MIHHFRLATFVVTCPSSWERQAIHELKKLLPGCSCRQLLFPGNLLLNSEQPCAEVLQALEHADTRFIGHVIPVTLRVDVNPQRESLVALLEGALELPPLDPRFTFRVTCNRRGNHEFGSREVEHLIGDRLADEWRVQADLDAPEQFVNLEVFQNLALLGCGFADELLRKDISEMRRHAPGERPLNRAEKKLREAFSKFPVTLPQGARALDLGSAPGGWTRVLAEVCAEVVAVDPAELDERVTALPNVIHVRRRAQDYVGEARGPFDLLTCDMNVESQVAARLLCDYAPLLGDGAQAILTIKFSTRQRKQHVLRALAILEACYQDFRVIHLPHNGKETTVCMRKKRP